MRRIREVLRLRAELGANVSAIATGAGLARSTVRAYLRQAAGAGIDGITAPALSDAALEAALFAPAPSVASRPMPDWAALDAELRRHKHVTRKLLWLEYKATHPEGYEFSQFKLLLSQWQKASRRGLSMRQVHRAGETVEVDYAGDTVTVVEAGVARAAQLFVACLRAPGWSMPRPAGPRGTRTGFPPMSGCLPSLAGFRPRWFPTISRSGSPMPPSTTR